jgi:hypothetical protein
MRAKFVNCLPIVCISFSLFVMFALASCNRAFESKMIIGEYIFQYPSGHVELLRLGEDLTYHQELYPNIDSFQTNDSVLFTNEGTWSMSEGELTFHELLWFSAGGWPSSPDLSPQQGTSANIGWIPPTSNDPALLAFPADDSYYFIRITDRANLPSGLTEQANRRKR